MALDLIDRPHGQHSLVLSEDAPRYMDLRNEKIDLLEAAASSCQIYLTFPADSTFSEEDVFKIFQKVLQRVENPTYNPSQYFETDPRLLSQMLYQDYSINQNTLHGSMLKNHEQALEQESKRLLKLQINPAMQAHYSLFGHNQENFKLSEDNLISPPISQSPGTAIDYRASPTSNNHNDHDFDHIELPDSPFGSLHQEIILSIPLRNSDRKFTTGSRKRKGEMSKGRPPEPLDFFIWTVEDVGLWLEEINLGSYGSQVFEDNGVNGEYLESLSMFTTEQILRFIRRCHMKWETLSHYVKSLGASKFCMPEGSKEVRRAMVGPSCLSVVFVERWPGATDSLECCLLEARTMTSFQQTILHHIT
ncbi:hypothetical protein J5N97_001465, partial [Dioscorea zingiberensis]